MYFNGREVLYNLRNQGFVVGDCINGILGKQFRKINGNLIYIVWAFWINGHSKLLDQGCQRYSQWGGCGPEIHIIQLLVLAPCGASLGPLPSPPHSRFSTCSSHFGQSGVVPYPAPSLTSPGCKPHAATTPADLEQALCCSVVTGSGIQGWGLHESLVCKGFDLTKESEI